MRGSKKIIAILVIISMILSPINLAYANADDNSEPNISNPSLSKEDINYGDTVTISTKVTDESGISSVKLQLETSYGGIETYHMTYNSKMDNYQCSIKFDELQYIGFNYITIEATDIYGNTCKYESYFYRIYVSNYESINKNGYGTIVDTDLYDDRYFKVNEKSRQVKISFKTLNNESDKITLYRVGEIDDKKIYTQSFRGSCSNVFTLTKGEYRVELNNLSFNRSPFELNILDVTQYPQSGKLISSISLKTEKSKTITLTNIYPSNANCNYIKWSTNNSKILKIKANNQKCTITARKAGTAYVYAKLLNGKTYRTKVKVTNPAPKLKYKARKLYRGNTCKVNLLYTKGKVTYKSSNKKIAIVSSKGTIKAKGLGKCTIYAKNKGKTYKLKVTVARQSPDFGAFLYDYDTRNNTFVVKFKNKTNRTLIINSGTYKVEDVDYKSFDRKIKLNKSYKINANKTKYIRFKVIGRNTWHDYRDFTLHYKFTFDGKKYVGHVWDEESVFKNGKYWYTTYNDSKWYKNWYY